MPLRLNGSTDGSVTLQAPADTSPTGTDISLTLPVNDGDNGQYLQTNGSGTLSWQTVTTGKILQVVQTVKDDTDSINSTTIADIAGMSRSITPVASGSSFLIISDLALTNNATNATVLLDLYRGSTELAQPSAGSSATTISHYTNSSQGVQNRSLTFLDDSPSYTLGNSLTYKWRWRTDSTNITGWINRHSSNSDYTMISQITVVEVAA